jgi:electron transfer flavoprotein alpha subunit
MGVLVFLEPRGGELDGGGLGLLAKAASLGDGDVAALIVGAEAADLAPVAARHGAGTVLIASGEGVDGRLPQPCVDALEAAVHGRGYDTVLLANSVLAADIAAGLAARLRAGLNWDLTDIRLDGSRLIGIRPALEDSVHAEVGWLGTPRIALFRTGACEPVPGEAGPGEAEPGDAGPAQAGRAGAGRAGSHAVEVVQLAVVPQPHSTAATLVERQLDVADEVSLADAEIVVAGGRGLGSADAFALARDLAEVLGGMVGASRAAVDAGWWPSSGQIGQTGKVVSPRLYIALGISGQVQHRVGMDRSETIIAVNVDPAAPIFEISDLGVVGDVHTLVPRLTELLRSRAG